MCNVTVPENIVVSPVSINTLDDRYLNEINQDNITQYAGEDAGGDVPLRFANGSNGGNPAIQYLEPGDPPVGGGFTELNSVLDQALENGDDWAEFKSGPGNPYITDCYESC